MPILTLNCLKDFLFRTIGSYSHYARDYGEYGIPHVRYNQVNGEWKELRGVGNTEDRDVFILNPAESTNMSLESYFTYHWNNDNHDLTLMVVIRFQKALALIPMSGLTISRQTTSVIFL